MHQLVVALAGFEVLRHLRRADALHDIDDEHAVVRRQRTSALGDDIGMRDAILVRSLHERIDAVVDILLNAVVDARLAVAGARAVVIDAQTATAVDELDVEAHRMELHIELCRLTQRRGDTTYLRDLATDVEVQKLQAVAKPHFIEHLQCHKELGAVQSELRRIAAALAPLTAAVGCQLNADAEVGTHA